MHQKLIAAALLSLVAAPTGRADGCKFASNGRKVPEREQRAFVEWEGGTETLHVAALGDPTNEGTVWVVPVRAAADAVRAEPVDTFPGVVYYEPLRRRAEVQLRGAVGLAAALDSGGLFCPCLVGGCGGAGAPGAKEASRVEKLGMVVTVVSAESRVGLEQYLEAQGVNRAAADLSSLDPYFGQADYAFVCGWVAKRGEPVAATGLKVVFPSPTLWFPLRPTRAYTDPVETVVFARGFVKPAPGCDLAGMKCEYVYGHVKTLGLREAFGKEWEYRGGGLDPMTRVTLSTDPQRWDHDLELVPGTTAVGTAALAVTGWAGYLGPLWSALLGAILGLLIPWITVPKAERRRIDWLAGAATGAAIVLTIWASAIVFVLWQRVRFRDRPARRKLFVVMPVLAGAHLAFVAVACHGLIAWINAAG